jgi:hypothetical protein
VVPGKLSNNVVAIFHTHAGITGDTFSDDDVTNANNAQKQFHTPWPVRSYISTSSGQDKMYDPGTGQSYWCYASCDRPTGGSQ